MPFTSVINNENIDSNLVSTAASGHNYDFKGLKLLSQVIYIHLAGTEADFTHLQCVKIMADLPN